MHISFRRSPLLRRSWDLRDSRGNSRPGTPWNRVLPRRCFSVDILRCRSCPQCKLFFNQELSRIVNLTGCRTGNFVSPPRESARLSRYSNLAIWPTKYTPQLLIQSLSLHHYTTHITDSKGGAFTFTSLSFHLMTPIFLVNHSAFDGA